MSSKINTAKEIETTAAKQSASTPNFETFGFAEDTIGAGALTFGIIGDIFFGATLDTLGVGVGAGVDGNTGATLGVGTAGLISA